MEYKKKVLQCVAVCCSVLQCVAVCCSVCCSVLQCVAVCCSALEDWWNTKKKSPECLQLNRSDTDIWIHETRTILDTYMRHELYLGALSEPDILSWQLNIWDTNYRRHLDRVRPTEFIKHELYLGVLEIFQTLIYISDTNSICQKKPSECVSDSMCH